ncbi:Helicase associated domain protein (plasmid) [Coraliomargarita sp. W4R53]
MHRSPTPHGSKRDLTHWWARYRRVEQIANRLGRLPRLSDGVEPADVGWPANQRRATTLTVEQRAALELLPGWSSKPLSDAWESRAEELRRFINDRERAPRVRGDLPGEAALAHWHSRQRVAERNGTLSKDQIRILRYASRVHDSQSPGPEFQHGGHGGI